MSSDIMTLIQHWIEELSEITGEEEPFSFRILVWELIYRGVMDQEFDDRLFHGFQLILGIEFRFRQPFFSVETGIYRKKRAAENEIR